MKGVLIAMCYCRVLGLRCAGYHLGAQEEVLQMLVGS